MSWCLCCKLFFQQLPSMLWCVTNLGCSIFTSNSSVSLFQIPMPSCVSTVWCCNGDGFAGCVFRKETSAGEAEGAPFCLHPLVKPLQPLRCCWWKKSCTTWDVWTPVNNGINFSSTGAGFLPSTVSQLVMQLWMVLFVAPDFEDGLYRSIVRLWCIQNFSLMKQFWITRLSIGLLLVLAIQKETGHKFPANDL